MNKENLKPYTMDAFEAIEKCWDDLNTFFGIKQKKVGDGLRFKTIMEEFIENYPRPEKPQSALNEIMKLCEINLKTLNKLWRDSISEYKRKGYPEGEKDYGMGIGYGESWRLLNEILQKIKKELEK